MSSLTEFVPAVLPCRVTFGQWLKYSESVYRAEYFVNNHYQGVVERGKGYAAVVIGSKSGERCDVVALSQIL
jgi:hypothetical protein